MAITEAAKDTNVDIYGLIDENGIWKYLFHNGTHVVKFWIKAIPKVGEMDTVRFHNRAYVDGFKSRKKDGER